MTTSSNNQQTQSKPGPIAQQLTKLRSNGHQTPSNGQHPQLAQPPKKTTSWTGFSGRTLWDWIQFFAVLALPIIVAAGTLYFTQQITLQQAQLSITASEKQHQSDTQIAQDQQQETDLQTYLDRMSDLLLNQNLRSSKLGDEVQTVARGRTLAVLSELNATRKTRVLQFLYEAGLISGNNIVISLANADIAGITLERYTFSGTNFSGANLEGANLQDTNFLNVNLIGTNLIDANLANSIMENVQLDESQLTHSNISSAILFHSSLSSVKLDGANLTYVLSLDSQFDYSSLDHTKLTNSILVNTSFDSDVMTNADLSSAILSGSSFYNVILKGANLRNSYLISADVGIVNTPDGYIEGIDYPLGNNLSANITLGTNHRISTHQISKSYYTYLPADIQTYDDDFIPFFVKMKFSDLNIPNQPEDSLLLYADLTNTNLRGAKVTSTQLAQAKSLQGAIMPDGTIHP